MSIDYEQLKSLVKEAMFTGGGINQPSAPVGIPHRMPASDPTPKTGNEEANKLFKMALAAREATELLIASDEFGEPIFDGAYEQAFKATMSLRDTLNELIVAGAVPTPEQQVVAPSTYRPKISGAGDYAGGLGGVTVMPKNLALEEGSNPEALSLTKTEKET